MKTWLIYKHTNTITGKAYIGQTCYSIGVRWHKHCYSANNKPEGYFHNAIRKYGTGCWKSEVLVQGILTVEEANQLESSFIKQYDTVHNGYNICEFGDATECSEAVKEKMREGTRKYRGTKPVKLYNVHTQEEFEGYAGDLARVKGYDASIFSDLVAGRSRSIHGWVLDTPDNRKYKPINRYWFTHPELGTDYKSLDEMCRKYDNITSRGNLSGVIAGTRKSHQGWKLILPSISKQEELNNGLH